MVDVLRGNIKKLLDEIQFPILEREDILNLLDGYVDRVIKSHKDEDLKFEIPITPKVKEFPIEEKPKKEKKKKLGFI